MIYRKTANRTLTDFENRVNDAAVELALGEPRLLRKGNRGELLDKARKKVADDGYCFKKGKSRSKVYGSGDDTEPASAPKRPKLNEQMREERIKELEEDLADVSSHITFKEKRCTQAEIARNYKVCDELTQEIMECKSRKREIEKQLNLLLQKDRRSKKRQEILRKVSSRGRRSKTPLLSSPHLSSDSVCSEASTPTSRSSSTKSSGGIDKLLEHRGKRRQLELALMDHSSRKDQEDQQEAVHLRMPSTEPLSPPGTHQAHSPSSDEDIQSVSTVHPTSPVVYLADEEELEQSF